MSNRFYENLFICEEIANGQKAELLNRGETLTKGLYLLGYADISRRSFVFRIVSFEGIEYLMPDYIYYEYKKHFLNQNYALQTLDFRNLQISFNFVQAKLRECVRVDPLLPTSEKVPQEILDLFYRSKKHEIFEKTRAKIQKDMEVEEFVEATELIIAEERDEGAASILRVILANKKLTQKLMRALKEASQEG